MTIDRTLGLNDGQALFNYSASDTSFNVSKPCPLKVGDAKADLFGSVQNAVASYGFDAQRAAIMACFITPCGIIQHTALLQSGSLSDVAFYERQVVELCFYHQSNLVVLVFYFPKGRISCPTHLTARFDRFAQTLRLIEMSMPFVVWKAGDNVRLLAMQSQDHSSKCARG